MMEYVIFKNQEYLDKLQKQQDEKGESIKANYDDKLNEPGWMPLNNNIYKTLGFLDAEHTETVVYLHCQKFNRNTPNSDFVVKANPDYDELDAKTELCYPKNWDIWNLDQDHLNEFKDCWIAEWKTIEDVWFKIDTKLFTYSDLDGVGCELIIKDQVEDFYDGLDEYDIEHCSKETINQCVEDFIDSNEYLNYRIAYIATGDISKELAERIDSLSYNPFLLFDCGEESKWLDKYDWCIIDVNSRENPICRSKILFDYFDKKYPHMFNDFSWCLSKGINDYINKNYSDPYYFEDDEDRDSDEYKKLLDEMYSSYESNDFEELSEWAWHRVHAIYEDE